MSSFGGLEIALRGLQASQIAQETTGHNIANANTEGYSRQEVRQSASRPYATPIPGYVTEVGQIGTGVQITEIQRYHDAFLDLSYRDDAQDLGMWTTIKDTLEQVELVMPEPSDSGLNSQLGLFWNSWEDLSNQSQDEATRAAVRQQATNLCSTINGMYDQLTTLQSQLNTTVPADVVQINSLSDQIAALNGEIKKVETTGQNANDLRDQRDATLDSLCKLVGITYQEEDDGQINVFVGGSALVYGQETNDLSVIDSNADGWWDVQWAETGLPATIKSGELAGVLTSRDGILADQISNLNQLATTLRDAVNTAHRAGYGLNGSHGIDFFVGTGADDLALSTDILTSTDNIAAASIDDAAGDGSNASVIAALCDAGQVALGGKSITDFYHGTMIQQLAIDSKAAQDTCTNKQSMVDTLDQQRDSVIGVSLDDETANLIRYQRAYQAAARVMTVIDEMLDRLINQTGTIGR